MEQTHSLTVRSITLRSFLALLIGVTLWPFTQVVKSDFVEMLSVTFIGIGGPVLVFTAMVWCYIYLDLSDTEHAKAPVLPRNSRPPRKAAVPDGTKSTQVPSEQLTA